MLDENGKHLTRELFTARYGTAPTQEDVDAVRQLLKTAPCFYGQMTLDKAVDIIQRRARLCVSK